MAQIVFIDGPQMGTALSLASVNTLGRDRKNSIIVDGQDVQAMHAVIRYRDGEYRLARAGDRAACAVNGRDVADEPLRHGDIVTLGALTLLFSDETASLPSDYVDPDGADPMLGQSVIESRLKQPTDPGAVLEAFRKNDRLAAHLETLYRTSSTISGTLKLDDLNAGLLDIIFDVFSPDRAFILLYDEVGNLRVAGQRTTQTSELSGFIKVSQTILREAVEKREGILTRDASADQRFQRGMSIVEQNIQSAMCSPIIKKNKILGAIHVDTLNAARAYTQHDLQLLGGICTQSALAIENVLSYERQIERSQNLIRLGETARRVSSYLSTEVIYREAVESAGRIFDATKASLLVVDDAGALRVAHSLHLAPELRASVAVRPGEGVAGFAWQQNIACRVSDAATPGRAYETRSYLVVPVLSRREGLRGEARPIGVLCVTDRRTGRSFDDEDQELLTIFAAQIGVSLSTARLFEKATVDGLTQLFTRQFFFARLEEEVESHRQQKAPMSVLMLDLDHFKQKNDRFGHAAGDVILAETARKVRDRVLRCGGMVGRYGGEEFVAQIPGRPAQAALAVAEEIRTEIATSPFTFDGQQAPCTTSIGVADLVEGETPEQLVRRADQALYAAKHAGRDRTVVWSAPTS